MESQLEISGELTALTADVVSAYVSNNSVDVDDLPALIQNIYTTLARLRGKGVEAADAPTPAVSARASVKPDYIICLEDGKKMKMLKRHLMTAYGMTPEEYREKWGLPKDYPMVAPNYAEARRQLAMKIGLGTKTAKRGPAAS